MSARVSFADLLKKGAEKDKQKVDEKITSSTSKEKVNKPTPPTPGTQRTPPTPPTIKTDQPISPERDYTKVANSIIREAVAQGLFIGKSKQIYDFLYSQTRGSIQPKRSVRITKNNLMRGSDIGSERTLLKNLAHLKSVGLIKITEFDGQHGGNEYEVYLPEESHPTPPTPPTSRQSPYVPQKVGRVPPVESEVGGVGQPVENKTIYDTAKTFFKDNLNDDDKAFVIFAQKMDEASQKLTGKKINPNEAEKWGKLAELLVLELELAARNTTGISSVPAFLTEVLRRRLILNQEEKKQSRASKSDQKKPNWIEVGKADDDVESSYNPETGEYNIKPLDEAGKSKALEFVREAKAEWGEDFLEDLKKWYLPEDWEWLMKELSGKQPGKTLQERMREINQAKQDKKGGSDNTKRLPPIIIEEN
jgi:hypothetical protein